MTNLSRTWRRNDVWKCIEAGTRFEFAHPAKGIQIHIDAISNYRGDIWRTRHARCEHEGSIRCNNSSTKRDRVLLYRILRGNFYRFLRNKPLAFEGKRISIRGSITARQLYRRD